MILYICQPVHNLYFLDKYVGANVRVHRKPNLLQVEWVAWTVIWGGTGSDGRCEVCSPGGVGVGGCAGAWEKLVNEKLR